VITCPKCGKDNQDHYKFCLGCGAELPRDAAPKPFAPSTPAHGMKAASGGNPIASAARPAPEVLPAVPMSAVAAPPAVVAPPLASPAFVPAAPAAPRVAAAAASPMAAGAGGASPSVSCPQCGHVNQQNNMFCGSCGFRLGAAAAPARAPAPPVAEAMGGGNVVLTALRADGSEAGSYNLPAGTQTVGRETGGIFAGDSYLSPRHATFRQPGGSKLSVKDDASLNGVYKKLLRDVPVELKPNDIFRIGQEIVRFEPLTPEAPSPDGVERLGSPSKGYVGRIALVIGREDTGNAFPIPEAGIHLGRERGDILFPEDGYVSGLHCRLSWESGRLFLTDLGSSNGTFVRILVETDVRSGDVLLMGQQLFRVAM
jgi:pSer/pThr/pTyr-binding forkhead associated (FHA) protein